MNKIKLLLLLLMAVTGMAAFADDASFEFVESDGGKTLTIRGYGDLTNYSQTSNEGTVTFKEALLEKISNVAYTKVAFINIGSGELTINSDITKVLLSNNNIVELDLGQATTVSTKATKITIDDYTGGTTLNFNVTAFDDFLLSVNPEKLEKLTLPLVRKDGDNMVMPALDGIAWGTHIKEISVPEGYTKISDAAFNVCIWHNAPKKVNLPKGLKEIGDWCFYSLGIEEFDITGAPVEGRSIVLPSTLETIGQSAFKGCGSLTSTAEDPFILPSGLKTIKAAAFVELTKLEFLQLNEGLEFVGNGAFGLTSALYAQTTITFPSTIKYLAPGSFFNRWYQDIYFTGKTAPVCPVGTPWGIANNWGNVTAFSANTQMGNNGFNKMKTDGSTADDANGTGYANRENYINNGYYFTILHFPAGLTSEQAKTYRDITRRYVATTFADGKFIYDRNMAKVTDPTTGDTFGSAFKEGTRVTSEGIKSNLVYYMSDNGLLEESANAEVLPVGFFNTYLDTQLVWPSQSQWIRNFVTVANGVEWDGVTEYRPTLTEEMFEWMKEDELFVKANSLDYSTNRVADANNSHGYGKELKLAEKTWGELTEDEKKYLSLILYQGTRRFVLGNDSPYEIPFILKLETGRWWSICLPFNMTKAQVDKVFGKGTHVCLFSRVIRTTETDGKLLRLEFTNDVYHHKTDRTVTKVGNGGLLKYTYGSNYSKANPEPADNDIVIYARESYMIYPMAEDDDASVKAVRNFGIPEFTVGDPLPTMIQANSETPYTISGSGVAYRFIGNFNTTASYDKDGNSVPVKIPRYSYAYGQSGGVTKFFILEKDNAVWTPFKSIVQNTAIGGGLNDWENYFNKASANVKQTSVFGLEEDITGVENVIIEASSDNGADKAVYNINGSHVGDSLEGLAPGVYVQQGKAYIVK